MSTQIVQELRTVKTFNHGHVLGLALACVVCVSAGSAHAQQCQLVEATPEVVSRLPVAPSYFTKVHADGEIAFFIGSGNHLLFLEDDNPDTRVRQIPGSIDPVPSSDGRIVTVPGLKIYAMEDILRDGRAATALIDDSSHGGVYQSVAVIEAEGEQRTYRVITDTGTVKYRDYRVDFTQTPASVEALGQVTPLCPGKTYKTIMLSKTGKYVAVYDPASGTSKIVSGDGSCRELMDLGYPTGKIEFSYDDTRVAFHVDFFDSQAGGYFSGVRATVSKDVFVMDLVADGDRVSGRSLRRLGATMRKGSGGYYPSFDARGRVVYVHDDNDVFSFHAIHPEDVLDYNLVLPPPAGFADGQPPAGTPADWELRLNATAAIGSLWLEQCGRDNADELTAVDAASLFPAIAQNECEQLVRDRWLDAKERLSQHLRFSRDTRFSPELIAGFEVEQILPLCRDNHAAPRVSRVYGEEIREVLDGARAVHHYCVGCHDGPSLSREDGTTVPNPVDFERLTESQLMASLARIHLPDGNPLRMPPTQSYFPPVFTLNGQSVDHRKVAVDYLLKKLAQVQSRPVALRATEPPTTQGCFETRDEWLAYRDAVAYEVSEGRSADLQGVRARFEQCQAQVDQLGIAACVAHLSNYAHVETLPGAGRLLDFEVSDEAYYRNIPQAAVSLPVAEEGIDLSDGIPGDWEDTVRNSEGVHALQYRSRTVVNPGRTGSLNRLLFLVEGPRYDKWVQFTLPEPNTAAPDAEFDPTGFRDGTGPEQLVDFIAVDKSVAPHRIHFAQFWRDAQGRSPRPRLAAYRRAYGIDDAPADQNTADTCYSCHPSAMRRLSPQPGSVGRDQFEVLALFNQRMADYWTDAGPLDWNGAIHPEYYGPPRGQQVGCATCHNNGEPGTLQAIRQGPLTYKTSGSHLRHKVLTDLSMPLESYVYNADDPWSPTVGGAVVSSLRATWLLPDNLRIPLSKQWIDGSRRTSGYPEAADAFRDMTELNLFSTPVQDLFPSDMPYVEPSWWLRYDALESERTRFLSYRRDILGRFEDPVRGRRDLGRWLTRCEGEPLGAIATEPVGDLLLDETGNVAQRQTLEFRVSPSRPVTVRLQTLSGDADLTVYQAASQICRSGAGGLNDDVCELNTTGEVEVRVYGYQASRFQLTVR